MVPVPSPPGPLPCQPQCGACPTGSASPRLPLAGRSPPCAPSGSWAGSSSRICPFLICPRYVMDASITHYTQIEESPATTIHIIACQGRARKSRQSLWLARQGRDPSAAGALTGGNRSAAMRPRQWGHWRHGTAMSLSPRPGRTASVGAGQLLAWRNHGPEPANGNDAGAGAMPPDRHYSAFGEDIPDRFLSSPRRCFSSGLPARATACLRATAFTFDHIQLARVSTGK